MNLIERRRAVWACVLVYVAAASTGPWSWLLAGVLGVVVYQLLFGETWQ